MKLFNLKNLLGINVRTKLMVIAITIVFLVLFVSPAFRGGAQAIDTGLDAAAGQAQLPMKSDLIGVVGQIIYTILGFLGIAFIILVLYGGAIRMFAKGDTTAIKKSTGIITSAAIGVAIIMASYIITAFVFDQVESNIGSGGGGDGGDNNNSCTASDTRTGKCQTSLSCINGLTCEVCTIQKGGAWSANQTCTTSGNNNNNGNTGKNLGETCNWNSECASNYCAPEGRCSVTPSQPGNTNGGAECYSNNDCPVGYICVNEVCEVD